MFRKSSAGKIALFVFAPATIGAVAAHVRPLQAHVRFLATSTSVHGLGTNQDVYLAEITLRGSDETTLVRLIDEYPPSRVMLSSEALTSPKGVILKIKRDDTCDRALGGMPLRTAPGDPLAILPESLGFQPQLSSGIKPDTVLPCYRTVR